MKRVLLSILLLGAIVSVAQAKEKKNYWVLETNSYVEGSSWIKIYDQNNQLVKEMKLEGVFIDLNKKKDRKLLEKKLKELNSSLIIASRRYQFMA